MGRNATRYRVTEPRSVGGCGAHAPSPLPTVPTPARADDLAGAILGDQVVQPLRNWLPGLKDRITAFRSTIRGTLAIFGGNGAQKTWTAMGKAALVAEGWHHEIACPPTCKQHGKGSCGKHCCPTPERGGADYQTLGCTAGYELPCPVHKPLIFAAPRFILVGCLDLPRFWSAIYDECLRKLLSRYPDGKPRWREERHANRITANDGSYIFQAVTYTEGPTKVESWNPALIVDDEVPDDFAIWRAQRRRCWRRATQIIIAGTPVELLRGNPKATWIIHDLVNKRLNPKANIQVLNLDSRDNIFLSDDARQTVIEDAAQMLAEGRNLEYDITVRGIPSMRQDAAIFDAATIEKQRPFVRPGVKWWVTFPSGAIDDAARSAYFDGATKFPDGCGLTPDARNTLEMKRVLSKHYGAACYDCEHVCHLFQAPPKRVVRPGEYPKLVVDRPVGDAAAVTLDVWAARNPADDYTLGADSAGGGTGGDFHVASVFSQLTGEQVAQFRGQGSRHAFAGIVSALWRYYDCKILVIERNGCGADVIDSVQTEFGVPDAVLFSRLDKTVRLPSGDPVRVPGFVTTRGSKEGDSTLLSSYGSTLGPIAAFCRRARTGEIVIHSPQSFQEMQTFVQLPSGRIEAIAGAHDDCVMADSFAIFALELRRQTERLFQTPEAPLPPLSPGLREEDTVPDFFAPREDPDEYGTIWHG